MPGKKGSHNHQAPRAAAATTGSANPPDAAALASALSPQALGPGSITEMQQLFDVLLASGSEHSVSDVLGAADIDSEALRQQLLRASPSTLERYIFHGEIDEALRARARGAGAPGSIASAAAGRRAQAAGEDGAAAAGKAMTEPKWAELLDNLEPVDVSQLLADDIDEDQTQISSMVEKLEVLPLPLLRKCVAPWRDPSNEHESVKQLCNNIVETVRYLAAVHLLTVADKFQCLPGAEDRINLINNMMMSLWEGIGLLQPKIRDHVALLLGVPVPASAHDICVAVSGLGISTFFAALPLADLKLVCEELSCEGPPPETNDEDLLPDIYCQRLCSYFYPSLSVQPEAEKCCAVRTTVHENGPGSYTCTIDNACLLSMIGQRTHISNVFTCNKVKWRARVHVHMDSHLSFSVIQRQHPRVKATMVLRSVSESKAKKAANNGAANGQGQPLRLEMTEECTPQKPICFNHIVSVMEVINSTGKAPKGLYNNAEDRLSFHFTLTNDVLEVGPENGSYPTSPAAVEKPKAGTKMEPPKLKPGMTKAQRAAVERGDPTLVGKPKGKDAEKPEKLDSEKSVKPAQETPTSAEPPLSAKKRKEFEKKRKTVEQAETAEREKIMQQCQSATSTLHSDSNKSRQGALQRQRDRERRQELARSQPNQELEQQVRKLQQDALQARSALAKAQDDRAVVDKEVAKQQQLIANRRKEIEACAERLAAAKAAIEAAEKEGEELAEQRTRVGEELERAMEQEKRASQFKDIVDFAAPVEERSTGTATIGDISSFWAGGAPAPAPAGKSDNASAAGASVTAAPAMSTPGSAGMSSSNPPGGFSSDVFHTSHGAFGDRSTTSPPPPPQSSSGVGSFGSFGGGGGGGNGHGGFHNNFGGAFSNGSGPHGMHPGHHGPHHGHHHHHHHGMHGHSHGHGGPHHGHHGPHGHHHHMGHFGGGGMMGGSPYMQSYGGSKGWSSDY